MLKLPLRDVFWLVLVCAVEVGCTNLNHNSSPSPRSVPIPWDEVPAAVVESFRQHYPEVENPSVERFVETKRGCLFKLPSGGWVTFDKDGNRLGGVF